MKKDNQEYLFDKIRKRNMKVNKIGDPNHNPTPGYYKKRGFFSKSFWNKKNSNLLEQLSDEKFSFLDIRLRGNEIHVYYKGGKILGIKPTILEFDKKYFKLKEHPEVNIKELQKKWFDTKKEKDMSLKSDKVRLDLLSFITDITLVMDAWFDENKHDERGDQQEISLAKHDNLYILDIEFAVSFNSKCYNKEYKDAKRRIKENDMYQPYKRYPNPRFDLIGLDTNGQIHVFELKTGISSTGNMQEHVEDFVNMIGSENENFNTKRFEEFNREMESILNSYNTRKEFKIKIPVEIDINKRPIFHFIFTEKNNEEKFNEFQDMVKDVFYNLGKKPEYKKLINDKILNTTAIKVSKEEKYKINLPHENHNTQGERSNWWMYH